MADHSLLTAQTSVERAFLRLQASEVLTLCQEEGDARPMFNLVESLVFAGPKSLNAMREILAEVQLRQTQLKDDQQQAFTQMKAELGRYAVSLPELPTPASLYRLTPAGILRLLRRQGVSRDKDLLNCLQALQISVELINDTEEHLKLLEEIELHLEDWRWGLMCQSARQAWPGEGTPSAVKKIDRTEKNL